MDQKCSKSMLKRFWTGLSAWADSETNLFNCTTEPLHFASAELHPPLFRLVRIQDGEQKRPADPALPKEGAEAGSSQAVQEVRCHVGNLAQGRVKAPAAPDRPGTLRKGAKERCQWDVQDT